jgi:hypothetical protein
MVSVELSVLQIKTIFFVNTKFYLNNPLNLLLGSYLKIKTVPLK